MMGIRKPGMIRIMMLAVFLAWQGSVMAQQRKGGPDPLLHLPAGSLRLDSLGNKIARQSGFIFSFNATVINPTKRIELQGAPIRLKALLLYLDHHYHLLSRMYGNHIILHHDAPAKHPASRVVRTKRKQQADKKSIQSVTIDSARASPVQQASANLSELPLITSPIRFKTTPVPVPLSVVMHHDKRSVAAVKSHGVAPGPPHMKPAPSPAIAADRQKSKKLQKNRISIRKAGSEFFASAGLTANETFYLGPQINAGLPWLYGIAGWRTNFDVSGFSYGMGTSVQLSDSWALQLTATSGTLSNHYRWSSHDTLIGSIQAKGRLTRLGLLATVQINSRWKIQFGPVFNLLKTAHHSQADSAWATSTLPPSTDMRKKYYLLRPPYTLSDTYNDKSATGKKTWIGLQIGLFYRFR
jgi:hypothetical protein